MRVEYAYRSYTDYQAVLWAHADSRENLISDFVTIAALLQLPEQDMKNQMIVIPCRQAVAQYTVRSGCRLRQGMM